MDPASSHYAQTSPKTGPSPTGSNMLQAIAQTVDSVLFSPRNSPRHMDIERAAYILAAFESAQYFQEHLRLARNLVQGPALLEFALDQANLDGLVLEFGVASGSSMRLIAGRSPRYTVHGFDSFEGLPEDWTHFQRKGRFSSAGQPPANMPPNCQFHVGWFQDTLPPFLSQHAEPVRFAHIDCDLYASTKTVLDALADRLVPGSVLVFDEFWNYPGWQNHEVKALKEFTDETGLEFSFIGFASAYTSVAVRVEAPAKT